MDKLKRRLSRIWHMGRNIPLKQIVRRLQLHVLWRRELKRPLSDAEQALIDEAMSALQEGQQTTTPVYLELPCSRTTIQSPVNWYPIVSDPASDARLAQQHYMNYLDDADPVTSQILIDDWIANNPPGTIKGRRYGWRPYNLSIRISAWARALKRHQCHLEPAFIERAEHSLANQTNHLMRFLETDLRGNHLIKNLKALLHAGHAFKDKHPNAHEWWAKGHALLARELAEQVLSDGAHYERSPPYHCQVLGDFIEIRPWLKDDPLGHVLDDALKRMTQALAKLTHPDGLPAQFNDGGLTMSPLPARLFKALDYSEQPSGSFSLPDAGYYGWREGHDYIVIDCGKLGPDYLIGHGHGDILSFEWSVGGRRIIVDQGTHQNLQGPKRQASRATASHNTVTIDDANQGDFYGAHRCGRRPKAQVMAFEADAHGFRLEGLHDGYARLEGAPVHRRIFQVSQNHIEIEDIIEWTHSSKPDVVCSSSLLLHPGCDIRMDGRRAMITHGGIHVHIESDTDWQLEEAEWYPDLHVIERTKRLRCQIDPNLAVSKLTLMRVN